MRYYQGIDDLLLNLVFWWILLLIFQRVSNRYPEKNTWKKDIFITLLQSVIVLILLNVFRIFFN